MTDPFVREFILDEDQQEFLLDLLAEKEPEMSRAGVYNSEQGAHKSDARKCDHVNFNHRHAPDVSLALLELTKETFPNVHPDLWFAQMEFIRYEGNSGQTFNKHRDDDPEGTGFGRFFTSVTMIEKSDDLVGGVLKVWSPSGKEYVVDLDPFETVIFPAYFDHEATPVYAGRRVVLISWGQRGKANFKPDNEPLARQKASGEYRDGE